MLAVETTDLVPTLQTAIGPIVMVSGVGLLLLTMTNRLGRVVDRARSLARQIREAPEDQRPTISAQLKILHQRAKMIRRAIGLASFCVLFAAILVIALFVTALFSVEIPWLVALLFICSMLSLIASLVEFIRDVNKSLVATKLEVDGEWDE